MKFNKFITSKKTVTYLYIPLIFTMAIEVFYRLCNLKFATWVYIPALILEFAIIEALMIIFISISNSSKVATIIIAILLLILSIANQIKIQYSDNPIFISDLMFVDSGDTFIDILKDTIYDMISNFIQPIKILVFLLGSAVAVGCLNNINSYAIKKRLIMGGASCAGIIFILLPITPVNNVILHVFYSLGTRNMEYSTNNIVYYNKYGVISGMCGQLVENYLVKPDSYTDESLDSILSKYDDRETVGDWNKPNIIMVFSESFWDIEKISNQVEFDTDITSNFNSLKKKGISFNMISPSFGGISANPELEMLTGCSLKFFNNGYIPYMQLIRGDKYYMMPSVVKELNNNDYYTKIVSTWGNKLFNCEGVYEYYQVDDVEYKSNLKNAKKKGDRVSDEYITDKIIDEFSRKPVGEQWFYMVLTAQAHMPYLADKYSEDEYDISITNSNLPDDMNETLRSYAQGIYDADKQLGRLNEYIQTLDEDTIIIFYGDHLPYLKTEESQDIYEYLDYFNTDDELTNTYRKYNTECLILANFDLKDDVDYLGSDLVMSYVFNHMNIKVSSYYKWLNATKDKLPVGNLEVCADSEGNLYKTTELPTKMKRQFDIREQMNWKFFVEVVPDGVEIETPSSEDKD